MSQPGTSYSERSVFTPGATKTGARSAARKRVLIVEDDLELWAVFERYSARVDPGLQLEFVDSSDAAIERLSSDVRYDAVVTDFCLPRPRDGRKVQRTVSKLQPWTRVGTVSALMSYRPDDIPFLAKPFTPVEYGNFLRELLGR